MTDHDSVDRRRARVTDTEIDRNVAHALGEALGEKRMRFTDRRLLWLYAFVTAAACLVTLLVSNQVDQSNHDRLIFQQETIANCEANRQNTIHLNAFVDKIEDTYRTSKLLTPADVKMRIDFMEQAKAPVPDCPPDQHHPVGS